MAPNYKPDDPIEGGRVYTELSSADLESRADVDAADGNDPTGYTVAHEFLRRIESSVKSDPTDDALASPVRSGLGSVPIDAFGFELAVSTTAAGATPFGLSSGFVGISVVWFPDPDPGVAAGPHAYLFARYENGSVHPIIQSASEPLPGCVFVANVADAGSTELSPSDWETALATVGVGAGEDREHPFVAGEAMLFSNPTPRLLYREYAPSPGGSQVMFAFGSTIAVTPITVDSPASGIVSVQRPEQVVTSRYEHDQWLFEHLGFLEAPAGSTWQPTGHAFSKQGSIDVPHWAGSSRERPNMSLVLSTLAEEDVWLANRDPWTKFEEDLGDFQLDRLEAYYQFTNANSVFNVTLPDEAEDAAADESAWSAVFISYVVGRSGVPSDAGFAFSVRHITYIAHAHLNRKNADRTKPFWLYEPGEITPRKGDILCKLRTGGRDVDFSVLDSFIQPSSADGTDYEMAQSDQDIRGGTHCDIVVRTETVDGDSYLETVGGNTFDYRVPTVDTVGRKRWKADANGNWVMVGTDNVELGGGSTTANEIVDESEKEYDGQSEDEYTHTIWEPPNSYESYENRVFGFIRNVST